MEKNFELNSLEECIKRMVKAQGFQADKKVYSKLCEFASKYLLDILEDSKKFSKYAERSTIQADDVNLVLRKNSERYSKASQQEIDFLARQKNKIKLSNISDNYIKLPSSEFSLLKAQKNIIVQTDIGDNIVKKVKQ